VSTEVDAQAQFSEDEYESAVRELVEAFAPRRLAIFQDLGDRVDGRVAAWGIAFDERIEIVDAQSSGWMSLTSPNAALRHYGRQPDVTARVIWIDPE
jgi:hypothetical protein